jgi:DNA polymerase-1
MRARTISYDIETTGLQEWVDGARIVSIGFTWDEGQAAVVPVHHSESRWRDPDAVIRFLKPALERPDARYVAHNGKFDCRWLAASGVFVPQSFDTMLAAHMLDENRSKGLKPLSQILLGVDAYDIGEDLRDAYNAPLRSLAIYNGKDTDYTLRIRNVLLPELKSEIRIARVFKQLIMPASNALTKVERIGLWVDEERLKERFGEAAVNIRRTIAVMREHGAPRGMNPNSPKQLGHWLYGELELPIFDLTRTGAPSTREAVLVQLSKEHVAAKALLKYRKWAKYANTYLLPWRDQRDHHSRLHPTYKLFGTVTGRLSCADPNLQQVPRDTFIRGILGAPPGWLFVEADYSQIELRIAAMLAREKRMLRAFAVGEDLHMVTACMMTGKTPEDVTPEERKKAKAVNFGFLYGMGARKFQIYALENYDLEVSYEEAQRVRSRFFESYPNLRPWHERQRRLANRYSRVQSPIGRVRHLPDVRSHDKEVRAEAERQAINSPVQSFASDLMLVSLVRLDESLPSHLARVVGSVHDQLLFEVRLDAADEILPIIRETMENPPVKKWFGTDLTVAVKVEIKTGQHWGEGKVWAPAVGDKIA